MGKRANGGSTPHGKDVRVEHRPGGTWGVVKQGNTRASAVTETKAEAVAKGRALARAEHSELVVKGENGRIQSRDSHGHDPRRRKG